MSTDTSTTPDLSRTRTARYGSGMRVYTGGELLGTVMPGTGPRGGTRSRWTATPARLAWRGATPPEGIDLVRLEATSKRAAVRALVEYLHNAGAPTVAPVYGADRD